MAPRGLDRAGGCSVCVHRLGRDEQVGHAIRTARGASSIARRFPGCRDAYAPAFSTRLTSRATIVPSADIPVLSSISIGCRFCSGR